MDPNKQTALPTNKNPIISQQSKLHGHHAHHHQQTSLLRTNNNESKLYSMISIETKDQLENVLEDSFSKLQYLINNNQSHSDNASFNELSQYANQSKAHYDEVCNALLYAILTDPANGPRCLRNLFLCNNLSFNFGGSGMSSNSSINQNINDANSGSSLAGAGGTLSGNSSYGVLISNLLNIITENYARLLDVPRQQLIWLLKELTKAKVNQFDKLLLQMLRNIQSGSLIDKNIWLAESMLDILYDQTSSSNNSNSNNNPNSTDQSSSAQSLWLYSYNELIMQSVYTYLRLISDHALGATLNQLRQRETEFCCQVLREKWNECMPIGRDLVRQLQNLSKINEFDLLWKDIINSPHLLSPQFAQLGGLIYLMKLPTRKRCLISRLTVDMERKIYFIITSVKYGQQKRYQDWFQRQYLNTPESQSLRVDLIRYICVVVHPSNEQLNAGLTPRWALCGWLINTCTSLIDSANLKLALFFDWLMYDAKKENIMLIEPAILLMYNSMKINAFPIANSGNSGMNVNVTSMLFDFLCRISTNYYWPYKDQILIGIMQSFKDSVEKRVIPSMQVFFANSDLSKTQKDQSQQPVLDRDLKVLLQTTFGNFFQTLNINQVNLAIPSQQQQLPSPTVLATNAQQQIKPLMSGDISSNNSSSSFSPIAQTTTTNNPATLTSSVSFGSNSSLFKQKTSYSSTDDNPSSASSNYSSGFGSDLTMQSRSVSPSFSIASTSSSASNSFNQYFNQFKQETNEATIAKTEPILFTDNNKLSQESQAAAFSSDEEDYSNQENKFNFQQQQQSNTNLLPAVSSVQKGQITKSPSPSSSFIMLQQQLNQFITKPFKTFPSTDDTTLTNSNSLLAQQNLENHLHLISSDYLRDKLFELNDKIKDSSGSTKINVSMSTINSSFKEILTFIHRDSDLLNNFSTTLTDLTISICIILKNDFTNNLLPTQFYSQISTENNGAHLKPSADIDLIAGLSTSINSHNFISLINDTILQRPIFCLFKELSQTSNQSNEREILMQLLNEIYIKQNRISYYFLYYMYLLSLKLQLNATSSTYLEKNASVLISTELSTLLRIYREFIQERHNQQSSATATKIPIDSNVKLISDSDNSDSDEYKSKKNINKTGFNFEQVTSSSSVSDVTDESQSMDDEQSSDDPNEFDSENNEEENDNNDNENEQNDKFSENDLILGNYLIQDMRLCQQDDPSLFLFMLPFVLSKSFLPSYMINNSELIYLVVSCIDSKQLKDIVAAIISQDIILMKQPEVIKNTSKKNSALKRQTKNSNTARSNKASNISNVNNLNKKRKRNTGNKYKISKKKSSKKSAKSKASKSNQKKSFKKETLIDVINTSLLWETVEQMFFWELVIATDIEFDYLLPVFSKLDSNRNSEAVSVLFQLLKTSDPTLDIVRHVIMRKVDDNITRALFIHWTITSGETKMTQIFTKLLNKAALNIQQHQTTAKKIKYNESLSNNNKKLTAEQQLEMIANQKKTIDNNGSKSSDNSNTNQMSDSMPSLDQILSHLNKLRLNSNCLNFILKESLLETLKKIYKKHCDEETKKKYADLFLLADDCNNDCNNSNSDDEKDDDEDEDDESENDKENNTTKKSNVYDEEDKNENENSDSQNGSDSDENDSDDSDTGKIKKSKNQASTKKSNTSNKKNFKSNNKQASKKFKTKNSNRNNNSSDESDSKSKNQKDSKQKSKDDYESVSNAESSDEYSKSTNKRSKKKSKQNNVGKTSGSQQGSSTNQPPRKKLRQQDDDSD